MVLGVDAAAGRAHRRDAPAPVGHRAGHAGGWAHGGRRGAGSTASWVEDVTGPLGFAESAIAACDEIGEDFFADHSTSYTPASTDTYRTLARSRAAVASCYGGLWDRGAGHLVDIRPETAARMGGMELMEARGWRATYLVFAGEVERARSEAHEALAIATEAELRGHRCVADTLYVVGEAQRLAGQPEGAGELFEESLSLAEINDRRNLTGAIVGSQAHLLVDVGEPGEALARLDRLEATSHRLPRTLAGHVTAARARAIAATGGSRNAQRLLDITDPKPVTAVCYVGSSLVMGSLERARQMLERWPKEPTVDATVRRNLATALVADAAGDTKAADRAFRSALKAAADHRLVQPFIEEAR